MSILHLCFDGNFINNSLKVFEKYYPRLNVFVVNKENKDFRMLNDDERLLGIPLTKDNLQQIHRLCLEHEVDSIVLHGIRYDFVECLKYLKQYRTYKVYWIFWGYELYFTLGYLGKYKLVDSRINPFLKNTYYFPNQWSHFAKYIYYGKKTISYALSDALSMIDYFCFWNKLDYELLQTHFHTQIKYKYFAYMANEEKNLIDEGRFLVKENKTIMINHQASNTGNHFTIMRKIARLDIQNHYKKIVPLSYGSPYIRKCVLKKGKRLFSTRFQPILDYMSRDEYFNLVNSVEVAVFGARRQEASGNISTLLRNGVKVFLREDNNLLQYYREKGYILFSFETDLNSIDDLKPLTIEEQKHNKECGIKNRIYYDQFMLHFFDE